MEADDCPAVETHTACPQGYLAWHEWAERMNKTHRQIRCPSCHLFAIWVPRKKRAPKT
jgi:hypothetical protein